MIKQLALLPIYVLSCLNSPKTIEPIKAPTNNTMTMNEDVENQTYSIYYETYGATLQEQKILIQEETNYKVYATKTSAPIQTITTSAATFDVQAFYYYEDTVPNDIQLAPVQTFIQACYVINITTYNYCNIKNQKMWFGLFSPSDEAEGQISIFEKNPRAGNNITFINKKYMFSNTQQLTQTTNIKLDLIDRDYTLNIPNTSPQTTTTMYIQYIGYYETPAIGMDEQEDVRIERMHYTADYVISQQITVDYTVIDIPGLMFEILSMPFAFISQAFNLTLFPGTPYQINIANTLLVFIAILVFAAILKIVIKIFM